MKVFKMKWLQRSGLLLISQLVISSAIIAQGFSPAVQSRLQNIIDSFQNNPANPFVGGMSVAIKADGLALWQGATGYAARNVDAQNNLLPGGTIFTTDKLSRIYSVTKTFTAALVLELSKEGFFKLDDPVSNFLPMQQINPALNPNVTIRQLLAHESGYSDYVNEYMLQIVSVLEPTHVFTVFETMSFCHQINTPGAERRYSSTNYIALGAIVEAVTHKPIEQYYRERFFTPLGLSSMYLGVREPQDDHGELVAPHDTFSVFNAILQLSGQPTFPEGYTNVSSFPFTSIVSLAFSAGGIVSNAADMAEWGNSLFGGRATSAATLKTMLESISSTPDEGGDYLGYGLWTNKKLSATDYFIGHNGAGPGYKALMMYQPDRKMTIALITNYPGCDPYVIEKKLYEALPNFLCGNDNRKEWKIVVCYKGNEMCVARQAAPELIKKGAYLGPCAQLLPPGLRDNNAVIADEQKRINEQASFIAYPNPFTSQTSIQFKVAQSGPVSLQLYDLNGRLVKQLFSGNMKEGTMKQTTIQSLGLPSGMYNCRLQTSAGVSYRILVLKK